jgi:hypothetical protein
MKGPNYYKPDLSKFVKWFYNQAGFRILIFAFPHW